MSRPSAAGIAALFGGIAALPYLVVPSGSLSATILVYLTQLPLFAAGLWLGVGASVIAGVFELLILGAGGSLLTAATFAGLNAIPFVLLVRRALLARTGAAGLGLAVVAAVVFVLGAVGGMRATLREALALRLDRSFDGNTSGVDELLDSVPFVLPGLIAGSSTAVMVSNGIVAQGLLARFAANWRPSPDMATLGLPIWIPVLLAFATGAMLFGGTARFIAINVVIVLALFHSALQGLAVLHTFARRLARPATPLLPFTYWLGCSAGRRSWSLSWGCSIRRSGCGSVSPNPRTLEVWMIELILLERVEKLGQMGQLVKVRPGYARNYLLPQKKALRATKENLSYFDSQRAQLEANNLQRRTEANEIGAKLEGLIFVIIRQAGESGQLYGSVSARDIAQAVTEAGFTIEKRQVVLEQPIKTLGLHPVRVALHPEVSVTVTANVAQSAEEAEMQAKGIDPLRAREEEEEEPQTALPEENPSPRMRGEGGTRAARG